MTSQKMSASKGQKDEEFRKYREAAPEGVDDDVIRNLIVKHSGNSDAIAHAIENMWHDLPDRQAVGSEWVSTSKPKKGQETAQIQNSSGGRGKGRSQQSGGRGSSGSGRGDRVGSRGANSGGPTRPSAQRPQSSVAPTATTTADASHNSQSSVANAEAATSITNDASVSNNKATGIWATSTINLAQRLKLAEEQKKAPAPAPASANVTTNANEGNHKIENGQGAIGSVEDAASADKGGKGKKSRNRKPKGADEKDETHKDKEDSSKADAPVSVADTLAELSLQTTAKVAESSPVEPAASQAPGLSVAQPSSSADHDHDHSVAASLQDPSPPKAFLKMGKWEAPLEASAFQFGSFGNFGDDSISSSAPVWGSVVAESNDVLSAQQSVQPTTQTSQQQSSAQSSEATSAVWSSGGVNAAAPLVVDVPQQTSAQSTSNAAMGSLFQQQPKALVDSNTTSGSPAQGARFDQKPSAPPGLEQHHAKTSQNRAAAPGQPRSKHDSTQQQLLQPQYQQSPYQQPPGIPPANRASVPAIPYGYAPGFDLTQSQYLHPSYPPAGPVVAPPVTGSAAGATGTSASQGTSATPQTQQQQQQQQQQQYAPPPGMPAPYGYYGNPYYANQAYYFTQPQSFYGQGRGVYQPPRGPYGSDPYGSGASLYPDVYQAGQFADSTGSYGGMPMHPSMNIPGASAPGSSGVTGSGGKQQKGGSGSTTTPQQQPQQQSHMAPEHTGYGYYNPRGDAPSWQYQQPAAQSWPGAMMGFPGVSPTGAAGQPVQTFAQQSVPAQQQQQPQVAAGQRSSGGSNYPSGQQSFPRGGATTGGTAAGTSGNTW